MLNLVENRKPFLFCLFLLFLGLNLHATKRYWIYSGTGLGRWNNTANWSSSSGGAGGFSVPGVNDSVYFDGNGVGNDTINVNANMRRLEIAAGYTGRIVQTSFTFSVVTSGILSGGIFSGGSALVAFGGSFVLSGTAFTSTSGNLNVGNYTFSSGSFTHNNGKVRFVSTSNIIGSTTFYQLEFAPAAASTFKIAPSTILTCLSTLTISGTPLAKLDSGAIYAKADISVTNTSTSANGNATIEINGTGSQLFTGSGTAGNGRLPNITINKSSGTLSLSSVISVSGNWTYATGTVDASTNSSTVFFYGNQNLDGQGTSATLPFYNVTIAGNTVTLTGNLKVNNNLTINSTTTLSAGSNTINLAGNWINNGTWTYSTSTVVMDGSGYNTITKASGTETFYNLSFNRSTKSHKLNNPVVVNNVLTLTRGRIKTTSTNFLELIDNATLSGGGDSAYVHGPVRKTGNDAFTFPLGDTSLVDTAYHPLEMTAPSSTGDQFEATYFPVVQAYGATLGTGVASISSCEYWTFKRVTGSSTPTVSLGWNYNCDNSDYSEMTEVIWNGSQWNDFGQASVTVTSSQTGELVASSATSFTANPAPLTIGYSTVYKTYSMLSKTLDGGYFNTDGFELYFGFTEEYKDGDGALSYRVIDLSDNSIVTLLGNPNNSPAVNYGDNHYRIDLYDSSNAPLASGYYILEVTNEKNEKWYLRFKI